MILKAQPMPDDAAIKQNLFDVRNAIAQQRIEGLTPSREVVRDLERAARGEIPVREVVANIGKRHMDEQIRDQRPLP
jgi:hypothetical protein